jgi:glycosyltransferase involved in cell wall biosynthesis
MESVAFILPSLAGGGAERVMLTFAAALDRDRFDVHLILLTDEGPLGDLVPADLRVTVLNRPRLRSALFPLHRALRQLRPDVAVSTMAYLNFGVLALRPLLPRSMRLVVREANRLFPDDRRPAKARLKRWAYRRLYRRAHRVIAPSRMIRAELVAAGVPKDRIRVLYNPVDADALRAAATVPQRLEGGGRRFVAAGRVTEQKGFDRLVELADSLASDDRISIFGDGPLTGPLAARARALGAEERIRFEGFANDLPRWVAGADAVLLPSRWEGLPNVALEALALGTPVIATPEAGGIGEIKSLADGSAVTLAAAGRAFADAVAAVKPRPDSGLRDSLLPEAFSLEKAVAGLEAILASCVE